MRFFWLRTSTSFTPILRHKSFSPAILRSGHWSVKAQIYTVPRLNRRFGPGRLPAAAALIFSSVATACYLILPLAAFAEASPRQEIKYIRLADVRKHDRCSEDKTFWIIRGDRVYDVTEWVPIHPGGEVILTGVGGVLDPFWEIFSFHNKQEVYDILEQYFIGLVDPRDLVNGAVPQDAIEDPFKNDPKRDARLKMHTDRPCNAETPTTNLASYITPNCLFFVRNHFWVPNMSEDEHRLVIELLDGEESEKKNGADADLRGLVNETCDKVVPRLIGDDHLNHGKGVTPIIYHGDLWSGNASTGSIDGGGTQAVVFDPSAIYGHNEYDLGFINMFGSFSGFFSEYHKLCPKTKPVEEYEHRVKLYELSHHLNHHALFGGGYRSGPVRVMRDLLSKYG